MEKKLTVFCSPLYFALRRPAGFCAYINVVFGVRAEIKLVCFYKLPFSVFPYMDFRVRAQVDEDAARLFFFTYSA